MYEVSLKQNGVNEVTQLVFAHQFAFCKWSMRHSQA